MIRNYLKTAWRTLAFNHTYTATNVVGLTLGLLVIMLIASLVTDELSYDRQWADAGALYRIRTVQESSDSRITFRPSGAPQGLAGALAAQFPEISAYTTVALGDRTFVIDSTTHVHADLLVLETDTHFFKLFAAEVVKGNPNGIVRHAKNLIITERTHRTHFGGQDVVGKLYYDLPREGTPEPFFVNAIVKDLPRNSHLYADAIVIQATEQAFEPGRAGNMQPQYIRLSGGTDTTLTAKANAWLKRQFPEQDSKPVELQKIKDIHLQPEAGWRGPMRDLYLLSGIGILILVLVCINFVNLTFAHAVKRALETGIRKVLGAQRVHLFAQLGTETLLLFGGSLLLAFGAYILVLPLFEQYLGHPLTMAFHRSPTMFAALAVCWIAIGLCCSVPPTLALSRTKASHELKKRLAAFGLPLHLGTTRVLIALQFGIAMVVLSCMFTIQAQLKYLDAKDLGYEPTDLLVMDYTAWEGKAQAFKHTLLQHPEIISASFSMWTPFNGGVDIKTIIDPANPDKNEYLLSLFADFDYVSTMGMRLTEGRKLDPSHALDAFVYGGPAPETAFPNVLMTETVKKRFGLQADQSAPLLGVTPVGTLADFHGTSLHHPMADFVIHGQRDWDAGCLSVRAVPGQKEAALAAMTATWNAFFPNRLSRINRLEEQVDNQYLKERKQFQQLAFFSGTSMLIALLGVLGIAIYTIERRVKEIGIRKVLGATTGSIVSLISGSFTRLVLIAVLVAAPAAWWIMHRWLDEFAYRIDMPIHVFMLTGLLTLCCMLAVVGLRALHAARTNPVDSLRDE